MLKKVNLNLFQIWLCLFFVAIIAVLPSVYGETNIYDDVKVDKELLDKGLLISEIREALDAYYQMDYKRAEELFDEVINKWPDNPLSYLAKGGYALERFRFRSDNTKEENDRFKEIIFSLNEKAIEIAKKILDVDPGDPDANYYLAAGHGNIGRFYVINRQWWKAFWKGKKGFKMCQKVVNITPDYYDAYLGLGIFHYFTATLPKVVKVLSFLLGAPDGDKERGIREIKMVADNSRLLTVEAKRILLRVYYWEEDWVNFLSITKWLFERYPGNIGFNIYCVYGLTKTYKYDEAMERLNKVNILIENQPSRLPDSIRTHYYRYSGYLSYNTGEYMRAVQSYLEAIKLSTEDKLFEKVLAEDFFCLSSSFAYMSEEKMAFQYLRTAISKGWKKEDVAEHPAWKQYKDNPIFIRIVGS